MNLQDKKIEIKKGKAVITETKEIELSDNKDTEELRQKLKNELGSIVRSVKSLKDRADEIKGILEQIEKQRAGPMKDPAF